MNDSGLRHLYTGKVRELYEVGMDALLMVATDRVSVFDVVLPDLIPDKGRVLTALSNFWFERTADIVPNHVISSDPTDFPEIAGDVAGRATLVHAARPIPLECVVRGYVFGHGWSEYEEAGTVGGFAAPPGLKQADKLPLPLFTPDDEGRDRPRHSADRAPRRSSSSVESLRTVEGDLPRAVPAGRATCRELRPDPRRHQVRVR